MGEYRIKTMERKIPVTMETDSFIFMGWFLIPLLGQTPTNFWWLEITLIQRAFYCLGLHFLFGQEGGGEGELNKKSRCVRRPPLQFDYNWNRPLMGVRRTYSRVSSNIGKTSPFIVTSPMDKLFKMQNTQTARFKKRNSCMKFYLLTKFSLEPIDIYNYV